MVHDTTDLAAQGMMPNPAKRIPRTGKAQRLGATGSAGPFDLGYDVEYLFRVKPGAAGKKCD